MSTIRTAAALKAVVLRAVTLKKVIVKRVVAAAVIATAAMVAPLTCAAPAQAQTVRIVYGASLLNVVPLGEAQVDASWSERAFTLRANLRTAGFARLFDDTEIHATSSGAVAGPVLGWSRYALEHAYAGKFRRIDMTRNAQAVSSVIVPRYGSMGAPPASPAEQMASHDPLTAFVAMGRAVALQGACVGDFRVFDGREHYRLVLSPRARGRYAGGGYDGAALVCNLRYVPVSGFKPLTAQERAQAPVGEIWFASPASNGFAAPLRIAAPTPAGELRVDATSITVAP